MPAAINPRYGTGSDPCVPFGRHGKLLPAIVRNGSVTCTAELGTVLNTGVGHFCSDFDPPDSPFYAVGRKDLRACARRVTDELAAKVIVDGRTTDIMKPRFEVYSPFMTVQLRRTTTSACRRRPQRSRRSDGTYSFATCASGSTSSPRWSLSTTGSRRHSITTSTSCPATTRAPSRHRVSVRRAGPRGARRRPRPRVPRA